MDCLRGIYAMAHRSNVPLQVFSGETTPILMIGFPIITEGLSLGVFASEALYRMVFRAKRCNLAFRDEIATPACRNAAFLSPIASRHFGMQAITSQGLPMTRRQMRFLF
jgi:hypothetical protein